MLGEKIIHFVETRTAERTVATCHWVERFYEEGRRVQVLTGSALAAQNLDQLLWTFAQGSFIPHRIVSSPITSETIIEPVIITLGEQLLQGFSTLVCDVSASFDFLLRFQMAVHFVLLDDAEKRQESRLLWQRLRDLDIQPQHVPYMPKGKGRRS